MLPWAAVQDYGHGGGDAASRHVTTFDRLDHRVESERRAKLPTHRTATAAACSDSGPLACSRKALAVLCVGGLPGHHAPQSS